jgi:hypothetical protein
MTLRSIVLATCGVVFIVGGSGMALCTVLAAGMADRKVHFWDDLFWPFTASASIES